MKRKYSGQHMTTYGAVLPGAASIKTWSKKVENISPKARYKLQVCDWHHRNGRNISLTARHFGYTRKTIRKWLARLKEQGPAGLNDQSREPKNKRKPTTDQEIVFRVSVLRKKYPAWSKYKITSLLEKEGMETSESTVGRILKRKGLIDKKTSGKRRKAAKNPKKRFPKGFVIKSPGDMVQMDVKHIPLTGGRKHYQFTAVDVLSKRRVLNVYASENSANGKRFLMECLLEFPFPVKAIQTDNGSTFQKHFAKYCEEENIPHYFIYPRSPKQNSYVEASHRADEFEFYRQGNVSSNLKVMRKRVKEWQDVWNNIRPHESLNYFTPSAYLEKHQRSKLPTKDTIVLQT